MKPEIYYAIFQIAMITKNILFWVYLYLYLKNIINDLKEFYEKEKDIDGIWFGLWFMKLNFHIFAFPIMVAYI